GIMSAMTAIGRPSRSFLGDPRMLLAPVEPYRPGKSPFFRGQGTIVELPISVTPGLRLPTFGTIICTAPTGIRTYLLRAVAARSYFNFEMHGIDLIGSDEDGIPAELVARQPDLRVPLTQKLRAFEATLDRLRLDHEFVPLREVAAHVQR